MVQSIQQGYGETGANYRGLLEQVLEHGAQHMYTNTKTGKSVVLTGPAAVYGVFQSYMEVLKLDNK